VLEVNGDSISGNLKKKINWNYHTLNTIEGASLTASLSRLLRRGLGQFDRRCYA